MFRKNQDETAFWPSLTDLILAVLLLVLILWAVDAGMRSVWDSSFPRLQPGQIAINKADLDKRPELDPNKIFVKKTDWDKRVELKSDELIVRMTDWERRVEMGPDMVSVKKADWDKRIELKEGEVVIRDAPLVIPLEEASGYAFDRGHGDLPAGFGDRLKQDIVPKIEKMVKDYPIEVMEIIGHTDGTRKSGTSNFDATLNGFEFGPSSPDVIGKLEAGSNADLGLARALSVASFLTSVFAKSESPELKALVCRAYSGAQLISPSSNLVQGAKNEDDPSRRRIELRFTRKNRPESKKPSGIAE